MNVRVRYFAGAREAVGRQAETLEIQAGSTVGGVLDELARRHPGLAPLLPSLRVAVGERFAARDAALADDSEVALIPPVGGG